MDKGSGAIFGEISEAYEVLSDDEKRKKYDAFGADWERHQRSGQAEGLDWSKYAEAGASSAGGRTSIPSSPSASRMPTRAGSRSARSGTGRLSR
jgi:DnaJ-class molecular chaperone